MKFTYVALAVIEGTRVPLAVFDTRSRCEYAIEKELPDVLSRGGLSMSDCDLFTVEQWQMNGFLEGENVKTLTSYNRSGIKDKVLVPQGMEGKTDTEQRASRFETLIGNKL